MRVGARLLPLIGLAAGLMAGPLRAQDSTAVEPDTARAAAPAATAAVSELGRLPVAPGAALWRSLLLPGWGQALLGRKLAAGLFLGAEGLTLGMVVKTARERAYFRQTGSARAEAKIQEQQDWLVLMAFNHLLSGLDAFVSAHLADFPRDLRIRAVPGGLGASFSATFRIP